ncbi:hypothetical protein GGS23DRAFT_620214 [Durotheca rogersii]|uniref:uncharacterized protein n=1 Tax=Durotheca rogersii TaxID=419775 RepID=UPI00221E4B2B|nr:uncharacterized protein GGS23DRAFT_620214 [Durotheca rogersii]KAI5864378.1 hypothetical protein GGS23DRAFT_620214 [Durotheca rogersii]
MEMEPILIPLPAIETDSNPTVRYTHWANQLRRLQTAVANGFKDYQIENLHSSPPYFLMVYNRTHDFLRGVSRELAKPSTADEGIMRLIYGGSELLEACRIYLQQNASALMSFNGFHSQLLSQLDALSRQPFVSFDSAIETHIQRMTWLVTDLAPKREAAWKNKDLINSDKFQKAYNAFIDLQYDDRWGDSERRFFVAESQRILEDAFLGLGLPVTLARIPSGLFDDSRRPTYVDYAADDDRFFYGEGVRPGVYSVILQLGGTLTRQQRAGIRKAMGARATPKASKPPSRASKKSQKPPAPKRKKRSGRSGRTKGRAPKRRRTDGGYSMDMKNADADIEDVYSDARFDGVAARPLDQLVTPTAANREAMLSSYRRDFVAILGEAHARFYDPRSGPPARAGRDGVLAALEAGIEEQRARAARDGVAGAGAGRLKQAKLAAFALKYLRALHTKLVLASPPAPGARLPAAALAARLDDWILHERVWNAGDAKSAAAPRTSAATRALLREDIARRDANIASWEALRAALEEEEGEEEEEDEEYKEEEDDDDDDKGEGKEGGAQGAGSEPPAPPFHFLAQTLEPGIPGQFVFLDKRGERRREERRRAEIARAGRAPESFGGGGREEEYAREDALREAARAAFRTGGPPGYQGIPQAAVYQRLIYMIVLTQWRCYQARFLL